MPVFANTIHNVFDLDGNPYSTNLDFPKQALEKVFGAHKNAGAAFGDFSVGGNQADILQMGPDGDFGAGAVDCDFDDPMNLDMDYEVPSFNLGDICDGC